jgi:aminoglycoside 3-N-acetyltransferase
MTHADIDIHAALRHVGVSPGEWVMLHGDAGVAAQFRTVAPALRLGHLIRHVVDFVQGGTLVVPTFTYSFTKGEDFDPENTPSTVGQFSEAFRSFPGVRRTHHPIFSVAAIGPGAGAVLDARLDDCFGPGTVFDLLYRHDAKIVCLGCDFNKVTFVHYVEQEFGVFYRSPKPFTGCLVANGRRTPLTTSYVVRDMSIESVHDLRRLRAEAIRQGALRVGEVGRFPICAVSAREFHAVARDMLEQDEYALVARGASGHAV